MTFRMVHMNINVMDLGRSLSFYKKALGLEEQRRKRAEDGSYEIVFLHDASHGFELELTWLRDRKMPYDLSDNEIHLCLEADDFEEALAMHKELGCVCFENKKMGVYFIEDPDGYWIEIKPKR